MNFYRDNNILNYYLCSFDADEDAFDNYDRVLELVGEIAATIIEPNSKSVDIEGVHIDNGKIIYAKGTNQNHLIIRDAGLYGMTLPLEYNGLNFPTLPYIMATEIIARADASFANIWSLQDCAKTILEFGTPEQKDYFLPLINKGYTCSMNLTEPDSGSDLQSVRLKAHYDESSQCWRLNGVKRFITNGDADIQLVLARSEEGTSDGRGLSLFLYDRKDGGMTIRRVENKLGIKGSPTAELLFTDAKAQLIGDRKFGLIKYVMSLMNSARLGVAAQSVGLSEAAYREATEFACQREQFGKTINQFPQISHLLKTMRARRDAMRSLLYQTARFVDRSDNRKYADMLTPMVKFISSEFANQIAYDCIQIHGGSGFLKDYKCERLYRDARVLTIYEGTSQLQVVAALRYIMNGSYLKLINEYETLPINDNLIYLKERLLLMKEQYLSLLNIIDESHSQAIVESMGYLIMGHLLLQDCSRGCVSLQESCKTIISMGYARIIAYIYEVKQ